MPKSGRRMSNATSAATAPTEADYQQLRNASSMLSASKEILNATRRSSRGFRYKGQEAAMVGDVAKWENELNSLKGQLLQGDLKVADFKKLVPSGVGSYTVRKVDNYTFSITVQLPYYGFTNVQQRVSEALRNSPNLAIINSGSRGRFGLDAMTFKLGVKK